MNKPEDFKVGDVVLVTRAISTGKLYLNGKAGTIKVIRSKNPEADGIGIEFQEDIGGHDIGGYCLVPFGFYVRARDIQKMEPVSVAFPKYWQKEWAPQLLKVEKSDDVLIPLEDF